MITQQTIQQIQSRIDIIDIVGSFVKLKKRGANYLGNCPFHHEKTPSFTVSPAKEIYKCFGCGKSGNSISFLMEHEKYTYVEALRWLAQRYHVEIEETEQSQEQKNFQLAAESLYIINQFAQQYFSKNLVEEEEGTDIGLSYLKERGFTDDTIRKFQLGYCLQSRDAFAQKAIEAKYNPELLQRTGLVVQKEYGLIDNYRGRVIFPVHNITGKIIGFGARIIGKSDRAPKYINTPENELYVKSRILYALNFARPFIDKLDECLLVEGYTDVISLHQAGIENVVASGGTSLTTDQLRLIKKYTKNLTILYDGDAAGVKAALRGLDMALEEGLNVQLVLLPDQEDPDSYVKRVGADAFREYIAANKKDFVVFQLEVSLKEAGNDMTKKAAVVNQIAETLSKINKVEDFTKQQDYIRQCAAMLKIDESGLVALVNKFIREKLAKEELKTDSRTNNTTDFPTSTDETAAPLGDDSIQLLQTEEAHEKALLRCLIEFGQKPWNEEQKCADHILEEIDDAGMIENPSYLGLIQEYKQLHLQGLEPTPKTFLYHENREVSSLVINLLEFPYEVSTNWDEKYELKLASREDLYLAEINSTIAYLKLKKIKKMIEENQQDLERSSDPEEQITFLQTHQILKKMESDLTKLWGTVIFK